MVLPSIQPARRRYARTASATTARTATKRRERAATCCLRQSAIRHATGPPALELFPDDRESHQQDDPTGEVEGRGGDEGHHRPEQGRGDTDDEQRTGLSRRAGTGRARVMD